MHAEVGAGELASSVSMGQVSIALNKFHYTFGAAVWSKFIAHGTAFDGRLILSMYSRATVQSIEPLFYTIPACLCK